MKKIILTFIIVTMANSAYLSAENTFNYLSEKNRKILFEQGEISRYFFKDQEPEFLFKSDFSDKLLEEISSLNITIGVETLFFVSYREFANISAISPLDIYNTLLSVKTMKGIEYYSKSRKKMRTLFTESYEIESSSNPEPLDDPTVSSIPAYKIRYLKQTDKTFGENIYKTIYRYDGSSIWVNMINTTKMIYKIIPMVQPGNISINLFVKPTDQGFLFYGITAAETTTFLGLEKSKKESFYYRIKAMYNWFKEQLAVSS